MRRMQTCAWYFHQEETAAKESAEAEETEEGKEMSVDALVDRMIQVREVPEAQKAFSGETFLRPVKQMVTLRAPLNARTGECKELTLMVDEAQLDEMRLWFRDLLIATADNFADTYGLRTHAPNYGGYSSRPLDPDEVLQDLVYAVQRDG